MAPRRGLPASRRTEARTYLRDGRAPIPRSEAISRVMSSNRAVNTAPERRLRETLRASGFAKFRLHLKTVPGRPDLAFPKERLAVFVHGCFWHRCPYCRPSLPRTHLDFWTAKFEANKSRDRRKVRALRNKGWSVLTVWECQLRRDARRVTERVSKKLARLSS